MDIISDNWVAYLKNKYTPGTKIKLIEMNNDPDPIEPGTIGKVDFVDDAGHIHMKWDNGRSLALIPNVDKFSIIEED